VAFIKIKLVCVFLNRFINIDLQFFFVILDSLYSIETAPKKKVEDLIHLAELCIDLLQQNEEHHSEVG